MRGAVSLYDAEFVLFAVCLRVGRGVSFLVHIILLTVHIVYLLGKRAK